MAKGREQDSVLPAIGADLPTGSVGEDNVALLVAALDEGDAGVLLPVPHGLLEHGALRACNNHRTR